MFKSKFFKRLLIAFVIGLFTFAAIIVAAVTEIDALYILVFIGVIALFIYCFLFIRCTLCGRQIHHIGKFCPYCGCNLWESSEYEDPDEKPSSSDSESR